jgi:hypothetical protein
MVALKVLGRKTPGGGGGAYGKGAEVGGGGFEMFCSGAAFWGYGDLLWY